jgi:hypothetical protein
MRESEMIERGFSADEHGKILDDYGNEYRNEDGEVEFLEKDKDYIEISKYIKLLKEKEEFKQAYNLLMDYWDYIPDDEKRELDSKLKKLNL